MIVNCAAAPRGSEHFSPQLTDCLSTAAALAAMGITSKTVTTAMIPAEVAPTQRRATTDATLTPSASALGTPTSTTMVSMTIPTTRTRYGRDSRRADERGRRPTCRLFRWSEGHAEQVSRPSGDDVFGGVEEDRDLAFQPWTAH